jgi:SPP1 family predicted phage head-tail adaptor
MVIRAGQLNRRLIFERRTDTRNEYNELVGDWVEIAQTKAEKRALSGREFFTALQVQSEQSFHLACRWSPALAAVKTSDRVLVDGVPHDIQAVSDPTGRRRELEFVVVEHDEVSP